MLVLINTFQKIIMPYFLYFGTHDTLHVYESESQLMVEKYLDARFSKINKSPVSEAENIQQVYITHVATECENETIGVAQNSLYAVYFDTGSYQIQHRKIYYPTIWSCSSPKDLTMEVFKIPSMFSRNYKLIPTPIPLIDIHEDIKDSLEQNLRHVDERLVEIHDIQRSIWNTIEEYKHQIDVIFKDVRCTIFNEIEQYNKSRDEILLKLSLPIIK